MTRSMLLALAVLGAVSLVSCRHRVVVVEHDVAASSDPRGELVVADPPPALQAEDRPAAPSSNHVWVTGYWTHCYNGWVWVGGCYALRPRLQAVWVAGYWERHPRGWVWIHGHWA
jgi:YXWGXW repeat-containing protein